MRDINIIIIYFRGRRENFYREKLRKQVFK